MILMPSMIMTNGVLSHCVVCEHADAGYFVHYILYCKMTSSLLFRSRCRPCTSWRWAGQVDNPLVRCVGWTIHSDWNYIILWHLPPLTHMQCSVVLF